MAVLSIQRGWESPRPPACQNQPLPGANAGFYFQREAQATETSMSDNLELATFLAVLIAFVLCGCLATRAPKKTSNSGPVKDRAWTNLPPLTNSPDSAIS